jgi:hypothetical protein
MKRTATTLVLLAGFGGGCVSPDTQKDPTGGFGTVTRGKQVPGVVGPTGEPVMAARGVMPAGGQLPDGGGIRQTALLSGSSCTECNTCAHVPGSSPLWKRAFSGMRDSKVMLASHEWGHGHGHGNYGPPPGYGAGGILPVPGMGPPGAVAGVGALVPGMGMPPGMANGRTSIKFTGPAGMKITWQLPNGGFNDEASGLTAPKEYNFVQGQVYRLRLTQVLPNHPGKSFYPTLEIAPGNPKTVTFLAHSSVPLTFTNEDFDQAAAGNLVVKVIYLPDRDHQDFATVAGAEELVSTRLEPGADPVAEAQRRGSILAIVRLGNIDLENKVSPAMTAPPPGFVLPGGPMGGPGMGLQPMPMAPGSPTTPAISTPVAPSAPGRSSTSGSATPRPAAPLAPGLKPPTGANTSPPTSLPPIK